MREEIIFAYNQEKGRKMVGDLRGKKPVFVCIVATTDTAKIPGLSAAGQNPDLTDYTPPADVELLYYDRCKCFDGVPVTPEGIPTPALITASALKLGQIPVFVVNGGLRVLPQTPYIDVGGAPGTDITTGKAVANVHEIIERTRIAGQSFAKSAEYLVIGESIPGGTTTALALLLALGVDAEGKVSSSMPVNPHTLKTQVAMRGLDSAGIKFGDLRSDPEKAIELVGDPMQAAAAGFVLGVGGEIPLLLAGGTQMAAVAAVIHFLKPECLEQAVIATTRWIVQDRTSDIRALVDQTARIPIVAANLNFSQSTHRGLSAYEEGAVREGVGAGGAAVAAILKSQGGITCQMLQHEIEVNYTQMMRR